MMGQTYDEAEIISFLQGHFSPGDVFEIRVLNAGMLHKAVLTGYFQYEAIGRIPKMLKDNVREAGGVYYTLNPVKPELLARAYNRLKQAERGETTKDDEIARRDWLLVDIDSQRAAGISATDEERRAAAEAGDVLKRLLAESYGLESPIKVDSGNGLHLLYRLPGLPADDGGMVKDALNALAGRDELKSFAVDVDTSVFNAARIARLPGAMNCKGDEIPGRPHRMARVAENPQECGTANSEMLKAIAASAGNGSAEAMPAATETAADAPRKAERFDIFSFMERQFPGAVKASYQGGFKWEGIPCPNGANHSDANPESGAVVIAMPDGKGGWIPSFKCQHSHCQGVKWQDFRLLHDGEYASRTEGQPDIDLSGIYAMADNKANPQPMNAPSPRDLGEIEYLNDFKDNPPDKAPALIDGVLRQGHKAMIAGPSKGRKSWLLLQLAAALAEGREWLGTFTCRKCPVLYLNMEIDRASFIHRLLTVYKALGWTPGDDNRLAIMNLRGRIVTLGQSIAEIAKRAREMNAGAVIIDPIYKLGMGDENKAKDIAEFTAALDRLATETGAAVIYCHHFSKGTQEDKSPIDRASGSGVFSRDADAIMTLSELVIENAYRLFFTLREYPQHEPLNLRILHPLHLPAPEYADQPEKGARSRWQREKRQEESERAEMARQKRERMESVILEMAANLREQTLKTDFVNMASAELNIGRDRARGLVDTLANDGRLNITKGGEKNKKYVVPGNA